MTAIKSNHILQPARTLLAAGVLMGGLLVGCLAPWTSGSGTVRVWLTAEVRERERLWALDVIVEEIRVHQAGQPIENGWVTWHPEVQQVNLVAFAEKPAVLLGQGAVPTGRYDRVWVVVETGEARSVTGMTLPLILTVEPIALPFRLRAGQQVDITVELIALPQANGGYEIFTKAAFFTPGDSPIARSEHANVRTGSKRWQEGGPGSARRCGVPISPRVSSYHGLS